MERSNGLANSHTYWSYDGSQWGPHCGLCTPYTKVLVGNIYSDRGAFKSPPLPRNGTNGIRNKHKTCQEQGRDEGEEGMCEANTLVK